jgi:hypothetical protein
MTGNWNSERRGAPAGTLDIGFGRELRTVLGLATPVLRQRSAAVWRASGLLARYGDYLAAMHATIRASVPLMELAARRCRGSADPAAQRLRAYFLAHVEEERDHDTWLIEDMLAAGFDPDALLAGQPSPVVARLVGPQYYWIEHHDPACLLGYIAVLESNAPSPLLAGELAAPTGLPAAAFRTLHQHAVLDGAHSGELYEFLDSLDPGPQRRACIRMSALHTVLALTDLLTAIAAN